MFELALEARLAGPCFRCLDRHRGRDRPSSGREYQATDPDGDEELETPYLENNVSTSRRWARDAIALALPDKILCRDDCAGLCPTCGRDLNLEPHEHDEAEGDPRWAALGELQGPALAAR